jgi:L-aminopeptidase/D-esterase-like protein
VPIRALVLAAMAILAGAEDARAQAVTFQATPAHTGRVVAGARLPGGGFAGPAAWRFPAALAGAGPPPFNTTIGVVATDAPLAKDTAQRVAWMAHDGLARAIRPAHTLFDGDTLFVLSASPLPTPVRGSRFEVAGVGDFELRTSNWGGGGPGLVNALGAAAADAVAEAIVRAARAATPLDGVPSAREAIV